MSEGSFSVPGPPTPPPPPPPPQQPQGPAFDFVKPFAFVFEDPNWVRKVLVGGLFYLAAFVLVGLFFLAGYCARLIRNVVNGVQYPLPEWDDLGDYFSEGLKLAGVSIVYVLPIIIVMIIMGVPGAIMSGASSSEAMRNLGGGLMGCAWCMIFPISFALGLFMPAAMLRTIMTGRFGAAFEFGAIWAFIRANFTNYVLAILVHLVANMASQLGVLLLCVGIIFTAFWSMVVAAYAFGQTWRLAKVR